MMTLHVDAAGDGAPVVLLHSSGMSGRQWRRLAASLVERHHRTLVPDLSGHGSSPPWPESTPFAFGEDLAQVSALLASLDRPAHVIGHSYGGFLALLAARDEPANVRSLALYEPVAFGVLDRGADADALHELARVPASWEAGREAWLAAFVAYWGGDGAWLALREPARAEFVRVAWPLYRGVTTLVADPTPAAAYRAISCPVLLLTGEHSTIAAHRVVERLAATLGNARVATIAGAGHLGPLTHTEVVNAAILDWLATTADRVTV